MAQTPTIGALWGSAEMHFWGGVIVACGVTLSLGVADAADFTGGWVLNTKESRLAPEQDPPREVVWEVHQNEGRIRWTVTRVAKDGTKHFLKYDNGTDGLPHAIEGNPYGAAGTTVVRDGILESNFIYPKGSTESITSICTIGTDGKKMDCNGKINKRNKTTKSFYLVFYKMSL
jgi:hypothetical protein